MEEYRSNKKDNSTNAPEKIDLTNFLLDFWHGVRKLWWLIILLIIGFAVQSYFSVTTNYHATYVASATVSVSGAGGNGQSAQEMADVFPYILTSGVLKDVVAQDMGMETLPGAVTAKAEEGLNLLTISVSSDDPQLSYEMLMSVIRNYPQVAEFVLGKTTLTILDETGIPTDTKREQVFRGSYKRGALKGAIIGMVILMLYVVSRRTVKSRKELKQHVNLEDFGSIPGVRVKKRRKHTFHNAVSLLNDRLSQNYVESLRKVRIRVMREMDEKNYKTLLVTSSIPGEGKTTLASNLAIAIAQQGKHVLLVDCDVRHPSVAGALNDTDEHPGLIRVLKKEVPVSEAVISIQLPETAVYEKGSLDVICGGVPEQRDSSILGTKTMASFLNSMKKQYDIIVLDTAPSELLADAPLLAKYADAALYIVRYDYTKLRQIREGVQTLALSGVDMLGYVMNNDKSAKARNGYGYGYRYGRYGGYGKYGKYGKYGNYSRMEEREKSEPHVKYEASEDINLTEEE